MTEPPGYATTYGGEGGTLLRVTNLNDSGAGSLRAALTTPGKRYIVFDVSGTIELENFIWLDTPELGNFTLDGSTAPSGGICVKNYPIRTQTNDFIIRHIRFRRGDTPILSGEDGDALSITNGSARGWIDHCSFSWGIDANLDIWGAHDITVSNCIFSEGLYHSVNHPEGGVGHSTGMLVGYGSYNITLYNNLFAHCGGRVPLVSDGWNIQMVNNLSYNTLNGAPKIARQGQGGNDPSGMYAVNFVGNQNMDGPDTNQSAGGVPEYCLYCDGPTLPYNIYLSSNRCEQRVTDAEPETDAVYPGYSASVVGAPYAMPSLATRTAEDAKNYILASAGATLPARDSVDARIVTEVANGTGAIIDNPNEVGGWPDLTI